MEIVSFRDKAGSTLLPLWARNKRCLFRAGPGRVPLYSPSYFGRRPQGTAQARSRGAIMYGTDTAGGASTAPSTAFILRSIRSPHPGAGISCLPSSSSFQWSKKKWAPQLSAFSADTEERDSFPWNWTPAVTCIYYVCCWVTNVFCIEASRTWG